ncbi:MAG TPA: formate dehydrogenase subunit delta [Methylovirgula sp.]|jgi:formate dehydrogenase subunit delta|nr:formate dehydrogenase subunit delta [Methylovirgula sp.]
MSHDDKLFYMANQIGKFFASTPHDSAVASIADHIAKFWDPRMRRKVYAQMAHDTQGLDPLPKEALEALKRRDSVATSD